MRFDKVRRHTLFVGAIFSHLVDGYEIEHDGLCTTVGVLWCKETEVYASP